MDGHRDGNPACYATMIRILGTPGKVIGDSLDVRTSVTEVADNVLFTARRAPRARCRYPGNMRLPHHLTGRVEPRRPHRMLVVIPIALIVLIVVADVAAGPNIHLGPLLVAAPAITAAFGSPLLTALVGVLAVVAQVFIGVVHGGVTTTSHEAQIFALVVVTLFVVGLRLMYDRRERVLDQTRSVADAAQRVLLRPLPSRIGPLRLAAVYVAAEAEARIGGDLYAAVRAVGGTRIMIGDVRGKGLMAISDAGLLLGAYRAAAHRNPPLPRLVAHLHNTVYWDVEEPFDDTSAGEGFVTAAILEIPDDEEVVDLINCGHPPPLLMHEGTVEELAVLDPGLPLGVGRSLTEDDYTPERFPYATGDLLLLYTDGVVETRDAQGTFYPLAERVAAWRETDPQRLVERLHDDLLDHAGGALHDDVALVAVERCRR